MEPTPAEVVVQVATLPLIVRALHPAIDTPLVRKLTVPLGEYAFENVAV